MARSVVLDGIVNDDAIAQPGNWYVMFLMPWRHPDGRVIDAQLRVAPEVSRAVAKAAERKYRRGVAVRVTAKQVTQLSSSFWNADGITKIEKLRELDLPQPKAVAVKHPLGRLVLDRSRGYFVGKRGRVELVIAREDGLLATATTRVRRIEQRQKQIRAAIAKELLSLANVEWRQSGPPIDAAGFERLLKLSAIDVGPKRTTLYYSSGSLFGEHGVEVRLGVRGAISEILIS